ncbi:MAG TPA: PLP-dependent aminotransferase family protein [Anaeromyxobacter sp.]|nr:PLP-dependent aminotransferase family protein [Anaeromyxobacter sp.]
MQRSWTTFGRALHLELPSGAARRRAIEGAIRDAIRAGKLRLGTELPSSRALARDLGLSRGTVVEAYGQLVAEGYLASRMGSGTVVAWATATRERRRDAIPREPDPARFSFRSGRPDVASFPRAAWIRALRGALARAPDRALDYGEARGRPELREALADYLGRARGLAASAGDLVVTNGFGQGLLLLGQALKAAGARQVAVEDPSGAEVRDVIRAAGLAARPIPVDSEGLVTAELGAADAAVVLTPAHQYPLGVTLSPARRAAVVAWARAHQALVIEDDYDGEFRYDRQPVGALQALDPARVVYAGTVSKVLAPGVRLGWLALPSPWARRVASLKALADGQAPVLDQLAMAELIRSGAFERHLRRAGKEYRRRRDKLLARVAERAPGFEPTGIAAGLHLLLRLPAEGPREAEVEAACLARGVAVTGLRAFAVRQAGDRGGLVVGYASPPPNAFDAAVTALVEGLADACRSVPPVAPASGPRAAGAHPP